MATPVTLPGAYDIIFGVHNFDDPAIKWRQTFTFQSTISPVIGEGIVEALATFSNACVRSDSVNDSIAIYNWARGRQPYPTGDAVAVDTLSVAGSAASHWPHLNSTYDPAPGEVCLRIDHAPSVGSKPGRSFLRGLLGEADITSLTGGAVLLVPTVTNLQADLNTLLSTSGLSAYFGSGTGGQRLCIVRYSPKTNVVHGAVDVNGFNVIGATTNKRQRRNRR